MGAKKPGFREALVSLVIERARHETICSAVATDCTAKKPKTSLACSATPANTGLRRESELFRLGGQLFRLGA
jgi:hypothetical protein